MGEATEDRKVPVSAVSREPLETAENDGHRTPHEIVCWPLSMER